ncbi:smad nuclear-interacting protein 1 [Anopheles maculipalpis]|uniref:smad nuclear-interacting protein 1 n=1 Tax=Anopheles maculipalpis TaxID=1496333 RepID=UPI002158D93B|nr:smad nuclear-interacting protein 1 [Anopheles maculipalpis]
MSSKANSLRYSNTNDDSSEEDATKERHGYHRRFSRDKRNKHKKHKKHKKSKKHKKKRNSSESDSRSKCGTHESDDLIVPPLSKKTTQMSAASPAENRYSKGSKGNIGKEVESHKQLPSRWDSSGEGDHSRQMLNCKRFRTHRSGSSGLKGDDRVERDPLNHEQYKSTRPSQLSKNVDRHNTQYFDNRGKELLGHRNENLCSRGFDKHGSSQRYWPDSGNHSIHGGSSSRDNEPSSNSRELGQRERDLHADKCKQSVADKYGTKGRKRRHADSPYKQSMGRGDISSQKRANSTFSVKQEKTNRTDAAAPFKWGTDTDNKSNPPKASSNGGRNNESVANRDDSAPIEKEKPNFGLSGKLTAETNTVQGVVIAYSEPPGARKPKRRWRLYPFKGEQALPTLYIHRQSCFLIGRDRKVCDIPVDHPSCSKQHAVLQYRLVPYERADGTKSQCVRPYIIDLESSNGTFVNNKPIETKRYLELREKDVLKFGFSSREYVLLHENSKEDNEDDEGYDASPPVKQRASSDTTKVETK